MGGGAHQRFNYEKIIWAICVLLEMMSRGLFKNWGLVVIKTYLCIPKSRKGGGAFDVFPNVAHLLFI